MPDFYAYLYVDPRDGLPFYIGKGQKYRAHKHLHQATNKGVAARLADLRALDIRPEIFKLPCMSEAHAFELERQLIECYGRAVDGGPLCNVLEAGERSGGMTGRKHRPESIEKIRTAMRARRLSPEHRANISRANKGRPGPTPELQTRMATARRERAQNAKPDA